MKTPLTLLATFFCAALAFADEPISRLRVSDNGRWLVNAEGAPVFLLCDTAWSLAMRASREDAEMYLRKRRAQGFNAVTFVLFTPGKNDLAETLANSNGHAPFKIVNGQPDPMQPDVRPGADNDFWDDVDRLFALTKRFGLYAIVLPTWGSGVAGAYNGMPDDGQVFNDENARAYGRWLGARYKDEPHVLWMLGGDRSAVYEKPLHDYRPIFRAMGDGLREAAPESLLSYHPAKRALQSGDWFHEDAWLGFNSIQQWPEDQLAAITRDWNRTPPKPTWVFEGRYEGYWKKPYQAEQWGEWQTRQQAWQTVFAGAFGHTYGHERIFGFGKDGWDWKKELAAPGANQLGHLAKLMSSWSKDDALARVPDQSLLDGDEGKAERLTSNRLTATRNDTGTRAMIYSANGRVVRVRMERLAGATMQAAWFNPRTGNWSANGAESVKPAPFAKDIASGKNAPVHEFTPPTSGDGCDWVLVLFPKQP